MFARTSSRLLLALVVSLASGLAFAGDWTAKPLSGLLPDGDRKEEQQSFRGRLVSRDDSDEDGNPVSRAFLESDDGELIPLPCERKDKDKGALKKAAGKALGGDDSCWDYMGQQVEVVGSVQSVTKKTKRYRRLAKITGISPLP
jgi:hypothetical protein